MKLFTRWKLNRLYDLDANQHRDESSARSNCMSDEESQYQRAVVTVHTKLRREASLGMVDAPVRMRRKTVRKLHESRFYRDYDYARARLGAWWQRPQFTASLAAAGVLALAMVLAAALSHSHPRSRVIEANASPRADTSSASRLADAAAAAPRNDDVAYEPLVTPTDGALTGNGPLDVMLMTLSGPLQTEWNALTEDARRAADFFTDRLTSPNRVDLDPSRARADHAP
ncbi:MAG: hypothetical protein ACR2GY_03885 [Phycisphaerales bacterium]